MYTFFLHLHSGLRWIILLAAVIVVIKSLIGWLSGGKYAKLDNILSASYVGFMHLQFLVGLVLYIFLSPWTSNFSFDMSDPTVRFWSVEHLAIMLLAIVAAQVGRTKSKKVSIDSAKFRIQAVFYGIALILILVGIPWSRLG